MPAGTSTIKLPSHLQGKARPLVGAKVVLAIGSHPEGQFNGEQKCVEDPWADDLVVFINGDIGNNHS